MKRVKNILTYLRACLFVTGLQLGFSSTAHAQEEGLVPDAIAQAAPADFYDSFNGLDWTGNTNFLPGTTHANIYALTNISVGAAATQYHPKDTKKRAPLPTLFTASYTLATPLPPLPTQALNYIVANTIIEENVTIEGEINNLTADQLDRTVEYFDGLGRPIQSVIVQGSPDKNDVVAPVAYDQFGRQVYDYLPYVLKDTDTSDGSYKSNALKGPTGYSDSKQYLFYQSIGEVADDPAPFALKKFEPSPLNRVLEQGAPGAAWQPNQGDGLGHTIKFSYLVNDALTVRLWTIQGGLPRSAAYYAGGKLTAQGTIDEESNETIEYTDKLGRVVLKEVESNGAGGNPRWLRTYYVYDDFNNLRYVFPPKATDELGEGDFEPTSIDNAVLKNLVFQYKYDERQRMIMKKVPGAEPVYMVYDEFDRLAFTPGRQPV